MVRRRPGEVRDAIIDALGGSRSGKALDAIHAEVEQTLGGSVAPSSVRSYLQLGTKAGAFERVDRGRYRLRRR
jgi:site-specific DNA-methyltransferase (adenine-specific)